LHGTAASLVALAAVSAAHPSPAAVTIDWVRIENAGNPADTPSSNCFAAGCGSVAYAYEISKYEITNEQYAEFLNAKAAADPLSLYNTNMGSNATFGGISRSGTSGSYSYAAKVGFAVKPVVFVSFYDALRFANWLHNGQGTGSTETGAYTLLGGSATPTNGITVTRNLDAEVFLNSENEWYKAAYYDAPNLGYFDYPAGSNVPMSCLALASSPNAGNCWPATSPSGGLVPVGAYAQSGSPYDSFDQGGNVAEWNEQIVSTTFRGFRGGGWSNTSASLAASVALSGGPGLEVDNIGFRVARLPPPPPQTPVGGVAGLIVAALLMMTGYLRLAYPQRQRARAT
jgi:formylglycine-generating enzyme required for sulfatase activity